MVCKNKVSTPSHNSRTNGSHCVWVNTPIEFAPDTIPNMEKYRRDAKKRIAEWKSPGNSDKWNNMTDEQIAYQGYYWLGCVRNTPDVGWDWAMWEQCQMMAAKIGLRYSEELTEQELFDNPKIPFELTHCLVNDRQFLKIIEEAQPFVHKLKRDNKKWGLYRFLQTPNGKIYTRICQRMLWGEAFHHLYYKTDKSRYFSGMSALLNAKNFKEALETEITVYRGIIDEECPEQVKRARIESWTASKKMARLFAEGLYFNYNKPGTGTVLEKTIKLKDVLAFVDDELEIILRKRRK